MPRSEEVGGRRGDREYNGGQHHGNSKTKNDILKIDEIDDVLNPSPGNNETVRTTTSTWKSHFMMGPLMGSPC